MNFMEKCSQSSIMSFVRTLMNSLTTMKFDGFHMMHEQFIKMTNIEKRFKSSGMDVDEDLFAQFILNSFPSEYGSH